MAEALARSPLDVFAEAFASVRERSSGRVALAAAPLRGQLDLRRRQAQLREPPQEPGTIHAEQLGCPRLVVAGRLERPHDQLPLDLRQKGVQVDRLILVRRMRHRSCGQANPFRQVRRLHVRPPRPLARLAHKLRQLRDVPRPRILTQQAHGERRTGELLRVREPFAQQA